MRSMRQVLSVAAVLTMIWATSAQAGPIGYSVKSSGSEDDLYRIDLATGAATNLGHVNCPSASGLERAGGTLYATDGSRNELWNITSPPGFLIGSTGAHPGGQTGLAYNPQTGKLYAIQTWYDSGSYHYWTDLFELNMSNGASVFLGQSPYGADGFAINRRGEAYAAYFGWGGTLYRENLANGTMTVVGSMNAPNGARQAGLAFDQDDTLWGITTDGQVYTVDTGTGLATYRATVTKDGTPISGFEGLAIPEPATLAIICGAGVGLLLKRRRHA